ncbi:MAG: hypothetical protein ACO1Q7_19340 [Gemmatimonas sp.]
MIGVGAPWIFGIAVAAALVTTALHFLSVRRPPVLLLPTMRFLPERPVRAVSRSARPSDLLLLLLRVAAILLIGMALSGLYWRSPGVKHGRIVVIQRVTDTTSNTERSSVARALAGAFADDTSTRVVVIDSMTHVLTAAESRTFNPETLSALPRSARLVPSSMSAALVAATRAANALVRDERNLDVVDLAIVAPLTAGWNDAAATTARALWNGRVRLLSSASADSLVPSPAIRVALVGGTASNAVQSELEARGLVIPASQAANATMNAGVTTIPVEWPANGTPEGWSATSPQTIGAVVARGTALVFPFTRTASPTAAMVAQSRAIAWWGDGVVAATEFATASSCKRQVGIAVPSSSNLLQGQSARALLGAVSAPCGGSRNAAPLADSVLRALEGEGAPAAAKSFTSDSVTRTPYAWLLLLLALAALGAEWMLRNRDDRQTADESRPDALRRVA